MLCARESGAAPPPSRTDTARGLHRSADTGHLCPGLKTTAWDPPEDSAHLTVEGHAGEEKAALAVGAPRRR